MKRFSMKFAAVIAAAGLLVAVSACGGSAKNSYKAGTYSASAQGQNGDVTVAVTVSADKITSVDITNHNETPGISDPARNTIPQAIVAGQTLAVDAVSGATVTSKAILTAAEAALTQAGANVAQLKKAKKAGSVAKESDIERSADVIVIGAGGAGLAAAVTANQAGATVIVIEKMPREGGNAILAGGALNAVSDGSTIAIANKDSVALHYRQTFEGGDKQGDPALVHTLTDNAWPAVEWLKSLGMQFLPGVFTVTGGMWPRAHKPADPVGTGFFKTYNAYIKSHDNIDILFDTKAEHFIVENGKVTGVIATGKTGNKVTLKANKGVVLAAGGFGQNIELRQRVNKQWPTLDASIKSTNQPGATGDGIVMAEEIKAALVQMENIQLLPLGDPESGSLSGNIEQDVERRIFVNTDGKRFVDEGARRDVMTLALFEQPARKLWVVLDSHNYPTGSVKNNFNESIDELVAAGRAFKADTIEDLAKKIGVNADNLKAAVADFNDHAKAKTPDAFGRTLYSDAIDTPPYYAGARVPTVHHTMGGVKIDTETHVIDVNGNIIPGLYAAGEVTGGIHGSNRLGGNALTDMTVFGRIAGTNASQGK